MGFHGPLFLGLLAITSDNAAERQSAQWDEVDRYADELFRYTRDEPLPWCDFFVAWGRALAATGRGNRDTALTGELERLLAEANRVGLMIAVPMLQEALKAHK